MILLVSGFKYRQQGFRNLILDCIALSPHWKLTVEFELYEKMHMLYYIITIIGYI